MRRVTWMTVGVVGAGLLLCGAEEPVALAQAQPQVQGVPSAEAPTRYPYNDNSGQAAGTAPSETATLRQTVLRLQAEVAGMQRELAQLRAELASLNPDVGIGGSGPVPAENTAPASPPPTAQTQDTASPSTPGSGEARVDAIYTGTVRSVSGNRLVLVDGDGTAFPVALGDRTEMRGANGQRLGAKQLKQGMRVRATVDMLAGNQEAAEIVVLPSASGAPR
ncbi:type IV pilus assembly protein FimV [Stigmatella aurantiaca]|uniref:Uncharacterized protein n=1 Tax=Stigmatella aurantiaca (strain DW4/3-1) TaxID=378806 RepID=Q08UV0_STIAD|nr:hypothetical protein [Stigmatella aurantiaca]ADO68286.1 uncharacterized protein STAUR_0482 [Stigmatella aurantiaca DW4/3-1]EAU64259.1 hypothetical protein STIAU_1730 [Stigmatella aurantiaca DW4/3-1]